MEEENDEKNIEEKMEQEETTVVKSAPGVINEDKTLLAQESGEEGKEDEEDVEEKGQDELLKEEVETPNQEEITVKELDEEVMEVEQRGGEEVLTFLNVKDPTDPLNVQKSKSFSNLAINSPKDVDMLDKVATDQNDNSKAEAMVSLVLKYNPGSNISHQADPLNANHAFAADVYEKGKEKQDTDTESEE